MKILLGSSSPRRNELLKQMGIDFSRVKINSDEGFSQDMDVSAVAEFLAVKKSKSFEGLNDDQLLITADTTVIIDNDILNKPADSTESRTMLNKLSGKEHSVITGVCLRTRSTFDSFSVETRVKVDSLKSDELAFYIENYKPFDKAGSYGIQEWFGLTQVESISGCYYNVVGLPCSELYKRLKPYL